MRFDEVVRKRRMVRNFQRKRIPIEKIDKILNLALHAPSAGYTQGWAYVVVTDQKIRRSIGELQGESDFYAKRKHKFISEAPVLIVACISEKLYHDRYREPDKLKSDGQEIEWTVPFWYFDIGGACTIILLATVNEGLAAAFTGIFHQQQMKELLGIPNHFLPIGVVSIGYPKKDVKSSSLRRGARSRKDVIHYDRW
ncbi:MAG TPA: nitroreductase family protein [Candidatus Bathyarchaeia archaeon]|nr:nitroreductase family protein [Candidatus Bathyarchaeia archaeon]